MICTNLGINFDDNKCQAAVNDFTYRSNSGVDTFCIQRQCYNKKKGLTQRCYIHNDVNVYPVYTPAAQSDSDTALRDNIRKMAGIMNKIDLEKDGNHVEMLKSIRDVLEQTFSTFTRNIKENIHQNMKVFIETNIITKLSDISNKLILHSDGDKKYNDKVKKTIQNLTTKIRLNTQSYEQKEAKVNVMMNAVSETTSEERDNLITEISKLQNEKQELWENMSGIIHIQLGAIMNGIQTPGNDDILQDYKTIIDNIETINTEFIDKDNELVDYLGNIDDIQDGDNKQDNKPEWYANKVENLLKYFTKRGKKQMYRNIQTKLNQPKTAFSAIRVDDLTKFNPEDIKEAMKNMVLLNDHQHTSAEGKTFFGLK